MTIKKVKTKTIRPQMATVLLIVIVAIAAIISIFWQRTLGFFQDKNLALVQTPQSFYNTDSIAHNLGLENILTPREKLDKLGQSWKKSSIFNTQILLKQAKIELFCLLNQLLCLVKPKYKKDCPNLSYFIGPPEKEVFYCQLQPIKDGAGSVVCSGTSFVVRRKALESIDGFVTDSLSEDYFTGIRLSAESYSTIRSQSSNQWDKCGANLILKP